MCSNVSKLCNGCEGRLRLIPLSFWLRNNLISLFQSTFACQFKTAVALSTDKCYPRCSCFKLPIKVTVHITWLVLASTPHNYNAFCSYLLPLRGRPLRNIWNPTSFNCLSPPCRACDYVYIDYVRRSRSSSCRLLRPINCQTYITLHPWFHSLVVCEYVCVSVWL